MPAKSFGALYVLSLAVLACGGQVDSGGSSAEPRPAQIAPSSGYVETPTPVVIAGTGFLVKTVQGAGGGPLAVDTSHRAWLGDTVDANELESVTWVNDAAVCGTATPPCLTATVPAGLTPGLQALTVENAFGLRGRLENAFTVVSTPLGALSATIVSDPSTLSTVSVGQVVTLTVTVTNTGSGPANVTAIERTTTPSTSATCGVVSSPRATPALPQAIASQASATFIWTCTPTAPGSLAMNATVTGTDAFTNQPLSATPATAATVSVQAPTVLTATITPSRTTVSGTQPVAITFRLTNGVTSAPAVITGISPSVTGNATCGEVSQSLPQTIPTNGYMDFTWTCTPSGTAGAVTISGTANGYDSNNPGTALSATPATPATVTVQTPAALSSTATVLFDATQVSVVSTGQVFTLTLNVTNITTAGSGASATITGVTLNVNAPVACGAVGQTFPQTVAAGTTMAFTWNCSAATAASSVFVGGSASGQDFNTGNLVSTSASTTVTIQTQSSLSVSTFTASPITVTVNQPVTVSMTVANAAGGAGANNVAVALTPGGVAATCTVSGTPPTTIAASSIGSFDWTCTPTAAGTLAFSAAVTWDDANSGASLGPVSASASNSVTVTSVAIDPTSASVAPRGSQVFTASGGLGPYTWSVPTHPSGSPAIVASGTDNAIGTYTAGATGGVTDVVQVTDSLGDTATAALAVADAEEDDVQVTDSLGDTATRDVTVHRRRLHDALPGAYTAGTISSVTDAVQVADSLGNLAAACVSVGGGACPL